MEIEVAPVWEGLLGGIEHMKLQTCRGDGAKMAQRKQQRHEENLKVKTNKPAWCGVAMWLRALMVGSQEGQWLDETFPPRNPAPPRGQQGFQTALPGQAHPEERPGAPAPWGPSGVLPAGTGQGRDRTHVLWDWKMGRRKQPLACLSHGDQGTTSLGSLCPSST